MTLRQVPIFLLIAGLLVLNARSQDSIPADQLDYFETHVRPSLIKYCYECHSVEGGESKGGLYLDTREGMRDGGSTGPLFDEKNWKHGFFVDAITWVDPDLEMPPKKKMPDDVIAHLLKWVEMGAPDPRMRETFKVEESTIDIEAGEKHWSFQKPVRPANKSIDALVAKKRNADGLKPVGEADAFSLLRRLRFDLTGLPPTPPEVKAFHAAMQKDRDAAIEQKVDALLASEQYGERWGRHWLDVVRYGESSGTLNIIYLYAWRFRNYVIESFNEDKPYDQLITEHLAGDLLPARSDEERQEQLIATGFLALGPKKQNEKNRQVFAMNLIDEQIDVTTRGFMGITVACARCHDHKFDPIPTTDYYAMAGIFKSTETLWGTVAGNQNHRNSELLELPIPDAHISSVDQKALYAQKLAAFEKAREVFAAGKRNVRLKEGFDAKAHVRAKQQFMRLRDELNFINPDGTSKTFGMAASEGYAANCQVLITGDINKPAQEVERGFLQVLNFQGTPKIPSNQSGRLQLAEWITSTNYPLTARVMVNRIWMHLTGAPIVETMDNFGATGLPPSNPELLDYETETPTTLESYGIGGSSEAFGKHCLLALRMVERGVRFVEVVHGGWDHHDKLKASMEQACGETDGPIAALLQDLKERDLLKDTLVMWGGEFGRTPQGNGGGVKDGIRHGATDEHGYEAVDGTMHIHDWHATILHLLGLNHKRLTYRYAGRDFRLTDVHGNVAQEILA